MTGYSAIKRASPRLRVALVALLAVVVRWRVSGVARRGRQQDGGLLHLRGRPVPRRRGPGGRRAGRQDRLDRAARRRRQDHHVGERWREGARDARAIIMAPNLVSARFIQFAPAYTGGPAMADGAKIGLDRTGGAGRMGRGQGAAHAAVHATRPAGGAAGSAGRVVNQAADTFDGNGDSFRNALRELSQTAGRLGDSRTDLFGTIKNLQVLVNALSNSNEQIVQFSNHVASVSQVLADSSTGLDQTLGTLNQALGRRQGLPNQNNSTLIGTVGKLDRFHQDPHRSQRRHRAGPARRAQRPGELLQHLQPGPGHRRRSAVAAELRQPRAVHLRRYFERRRPRTTTSAPRSAVSGWGRCCAASR